VTASNQLVAHNTAGYWRGRRGGWRDWLKFSDKVVLQIVLIPHLGY